MSTYKTQTTSQQYQKLYSTPPWPISSNWLFYLFVIIIDNVTPCVSISYADASIYVLKNDDNLFYLNLDVDKREPRKSWQTQTVTKYLYGKYTGNQRNIRLSVILWQYCSPNNFILGGLPWDLTQTVNEDRTAKQLWQLVS